jgi:S1-C subfamily serine protease
MRRISIFTLAIFAMVFHSVRADEGLAPAVLKDIKDATVFVKVDARVLKMSGSGFLIKLDGDTGYIVTNNHVIDTSTPHVVVNDAHHHRTISVTGSVAISVVFSSGSPDESSLPAEVVAGDKERDLAVLRVKGIKRRIKPIDLNVPAELTETLPVYVFGFPFGQMMAQDGRNPSITVGRGTISSIRMNKKGEIGAVQIDGALNPGNSGGPVVDSKGRLAGVAVATIVGSGIGLAIPPSVVKQELTGRTGTAQVAATKSQKKPGFTAQVTVPLIDPMGQLRSVAFYWVPGSVLTKLRPGVHIGELSSAHKIQLKIEGHEATGTFEVPAVSGATIIVYATSYVSGASVNFSANSDPMTLGGDTVATAPPAPGPAVSTAPPVASTAPPIAPVPLQLPDVPDTSTGPDSIDSALAGLTSENGRTQTMAADALRFAPLKARHRAAVLTALALHLASDDIGLRVACIQAYAHWATTNEVPALEKVAITPQQNAATGNAPAGWGAAVLGLTRLNPAAAQRAIAARKTDFFFCEHSASELLKLAEFDPRYAGLALQLLRSFDVFHPAIKTSLSESVRMLESDAASTRATACESLKIAAIEPRERKRVLALLATHLSAPEGNARVNYVHAYVHWAEESNLKDLQSIVDFPIAGPFNDHNRCWSAAVIAMIRLRAVQLAVDSYNSRADDVGFHSNVTTALRDMAENTGPEQWVAANFLEQLKDGRNPRLHMPDAGGNQSAAAPPAPAASPAPKSPGRPSPAPQAPSTRKPDPANQPIASAPATPIPAGAVQGHVRGDAFVPDKILMTNGWLSFRSGKGFFADMEIKIALRIRPGEAISGQRYHVGMGAAPDAARKPAIAIGRMTTGEKLPRHSFAMRYQLELEFGTLADDKLPGKIKLVVEDEQGNDLIGDFVADFK